MLRILQEIWPKRCLHCQQLDEQDLCKHCVEQLNLVTTQEMALHENIIAPFELMGPASSLLRQFRSGKSPHLSEALASWMTLKYLQGERQLPDWIVPIPQTFLRRCKLGYNPAELLAKELSRLLQVPYRSFIRCHGIRLRQESLPLNERKLLSRRAFRWKKMTNIAGQAILLVDDYAVTGATLRAAKQLLCEGAPQRVDLLVFAHNTKDRYQGF